MILQLRQIFLTEARTFIIFLQNAIANMRQYRPLFHSKLFSYSVVITSAYLDLALKATLLQQALILMRHQMCLNLCHKIHYYYHNDQ